MSYGACVQGVSVQGVSVQRVYVLGVSVWGGLGGTCPGGWDCVPEPLNSCGDFLIVFNCSNTNMMYVVGCFLRLPRRNCQMRWTEQNDLTRQFVMTMGATRRGSLGVAPPT